MEAPLPAVVVKEEPRRHEAAPLRHEQPSYESVREEQRREAQRLAREEPVHEEPKHEEPKREEPVREEPVREEPRREEPKVDSKALLESSGLVMIETDRSKATTIAPPVEEPQHLGRPRRERPKPLPQDEELQQVETRK
jgi:hypothetical protein